jgi:SAM-dependent methyltransferase
MTGPNASQVEYWNAATNWVAEQREHDEMLESLGRLAMDALAPAPGERVLDIGCGTGTTTLEIAEAVGADGYAVGADISVPMLAAARERAAAFPSVSFLEADAQTYPFEAASFDGAFSRFGVMFFSDPTAAFANIRRALRPDGRFAFVCWQGFEHQQWMRLPAEAAGIDTGWTTAGPNPFVFAERGVLARHLDEAGFVRVDIEGLERTILLGGHGDLESGLRFLLSSRIGRQVVENAGEDGVARVRAAIEPFATPRGVEMTAAVWVVRSLNG